VAFEVGFVTVIDAVFFPPPPTDPHWVPSYTSTLISVVFHLIVPDAGAGGLCAVVPLGKAIPVVALEASIPADEVETYPVSVAVVTISTFNLLGGI